MKKKGKSVCCDHEQDVSDWSKQSTSEYDVNEWKEAVGKSKHIKNSWDRLNTSFTVSNACDVRATRFGDQRWSFL